MNRGLSVFALVLLSGLAQAHVSEAQAMQHAVEHLWLLAALLPLALLFKPVRRAWMKLHK